MKSIPYGKQNITQADIDAVVSALQSDFLTQGPKVDEFEQKFARYVSANYAVAVTNGTAALHLAALALNVSEGDKVLSTPISFVASTNCVLYCGGEVDFVDIDPKNYCIDLDLLESKLLESPNVYKGIIAVDFAGYPVDLERLRSIANKHGLWIIEDACHAPGAQFMSKSGNWHRSGGGGFADLSIFSFHPVKHIACGEGGMITTNNELLYKKLLSLRTHGIIKTPENGGWSYEQRDLGYNFRIPDILCALGSSQLDRAEAMHKQRLEIASRYDQELKDLPVILPYRDDQVKHAFHLYIIQVENRHEFYDYLRSRGIFAQVHYIPIHTQPYYQNRYGQQCLRVAEDYYSKCISLPMYPSLSVEEQSYVIETIKEFYAR